MAVSRIANAATVQGSFAARASAVNGTPVSTGFSSAMRASPMSRRRVFTSLRRQRSSRAMEVWRSPGGESVEVGHVFHHGSQRIGHGLAAAEQHLAGQHFVQHHAEAQMSARLSTGLPRACSGDIYAAVHRIIPASHGQRQGGRVGVGGGCGTRLSPHRQVAPAARANSGRRSQSSSCTTLQ